MYQEDAGGESLQLLSTRVASVGWSYRGWSSSRRCQGL